MKKRCELVRRVAPAPPPAWRRQAEALSRRTSRHGKVHQGWYGLPQSVGLWRRPRARPQKHRYSTVQSDAVPFFVTCRSGGKIRGKRNGARFAPSPTEPDPPEHGPKGRRLNMRPAMHRQPVLRRRRGHTAARARPQAFRKVPPEPPPIDPRAALLRLKLGEQAVFPELAV